MIEGAPKRIQFLHMSDVSVQFTVCSCTAHCTSGEHSREILMRWGKKHKPKINSDYFQKFLELINIS